MMQQLSILTCTLDKIVFIVINFPFMTKRIITFLACIAILCSCSNNDSKKADAKKESYEKTKETLKQKEQNSPKDFILATGFNRRNLIGQTVIKGTVTSKASVAVFKDIDLNLSFYSKTKVLLESDKETVFEILHPGESKDFKTKYFAPKGTDSVAIDVLGAKVVNE
jgi:hypothetical protein